jgi:NADH dehydrogenase FAD-containing subunit
VNAAASPSAVTSSNPLPSLVLVGLGHAHLFVLEQFAAWRKKPQQAPFAATSALADGRVLLLSPGTSLVYSGMVPSVMVGRCNSTDATLDLRQLIAESGVVHINASVSALDANTRQICAQRGSEELTLNYDLLSLNAGGAMPAAACNAQIPGSGDLALKLRPIDKFLSLWPRLAAQAQAHPGDAASPYAIAVIGAGAGGIELALAAAHGLPRVSVSLISGPRPVGSFGGIGFSKRVQRALASAGVHVLPLRATRMDMVDGMTELHMEGGARLRCHASILANGSQPQPWLSASGLALDVSGFAAVNDCYQSTSHAEVFAAGDMASRQDAPVPRSGVAAVRAGPSLATNLSSALAGSSLKPHAPQSRYLYLLATGNGQAVGQWGAISASGRTLMSWKDRIDRRFVARFSLSNGDSQ